MASAPTIGPLTKVTLLLKVSTADKNPSGAPSEVGFDFLYGIGSAGLSDFEIELHGHAPGDQLNIPVNPDHIRTYFEHLFCPLMEALKTHPPFDLHIEVQSVQAATDRELVTALANKGGSAEGGCDCGCGCSC